VCKAASSEEDQMSIFPTKILLATDGSEDAELATTTAAALAKSTGSELHLVNVGVVAPALLAPLDVEPARVEREVRDVLGEQARKVENVGGSVAQSHVRVGEAAREVVNLAEEIGTGLIAVGSRGRGKAKRMLMGSVSDAVVRHAHCPVMVVRRKPVVFPAKILLPTDGSEEAALAARTAADLATKTGSELHLVHVLVLPPETLYDPFGTDAREEFEKRGRARLEELTEKLEASGGAVEGAHFRVGSPDAEIIAQAEEVGADMVVLGSRGLGVMRRALMGSVSDSVVRHAHCPILVVREYEPH
jgi:nucleotide-binding universal stress UspA family protein